MKWLVGPEAQEHADAVEGGPAGRQVGPRGQLQRRPSRALTSSPQALEYAHLKPSFRGYEEWTGALQEELDTQVFDVPNKTAREAIDAVLPALDEILADQAQ